MSKRNIKKDNFKGLYVWFLIILIYLSFINIFVLKLTPEFLLLQFAFLTAVFLTTRLKEYARDWIPFIGFFLSYEFLRGFVDNYSPFKITLPWVFKAESFLFGEIPTISLQRSLGNNRFLIDILMFFYTVFFYYSFLTAFLIWLYDKKLFKEYSKKFLLLSAIGLLFFFLIPTSPPWLIEKTEHLGIRRIIYEGGVLQNFYVLTLYNYLFHGNEVAALPSLHSAWPMFTSLFIIKHYKKQLKYLALIIPLMIGFSVVLTGEHYVLDVLFGYLLAYLIVYFNSTKISLLYKKLIKINEKNKKRFVEAT